MRKRLKLGERPARDELPLIRVVPGLPFLLYVWQHPNYCVYIYAGALDLSIYRGGIPSIG